MGFDRSAKTLDSALPQNVLGSIAPAKPEDAVLGRHTAVAIRGGRKKPFIYELLRMLASLGRRSAVAQFLSLRFSAFIAWWLWRTIYLFKLPGLERKVRVAIDWSLDLFFHRDIVLLKAFMEKSQGEIAVDFPLGKTASKSVQTACPKPGEPV